MIDFESVRRGERTLQDLAAGLTVADLAAATNATCDLHLTLLAAAEDADIGFVPADPGADDPDAADPADRHIAWTLGHLVLHVTASAEESAAFALTLARGIVVEGRSRYEGDWRQVTTVAAARHRVEESRRMRLAMLLAWPDQPHLEVTYRSAPDRPPHDAVTRFLAGLNHEDSHRAQMRRALDEARAARAHVAA